jgi:hypothetical protein
LVQFLATISKFRTLTGTDKNDEALQIRVVGIAIERILEPSFGDIPVTIHDGLKSFANPVADARLV